MQEKKSPKYVFFFCVQIEDVSFFLFKETDPNISRDLSSVAIPPPAGEEGSELQHPREFPWGFEPLRSDQFAEMKVQSSPVVKDPFCSPLLAPDSMLKGLPPIHIVVRERTRHSFYKLRIPAWRFYIYMH